MPGKLVVIEGIDGTGKATQSMRLFDHLKKENYKVRFYDFPQYDKPSSVFVQKYLTGKYGDVQTIGPYCASIFYALDRYDISFEMRQWLNDNNIIVANRYVSSNLAHQGGKIKDEQEKKKYFDWCLNLEYEIFKIPKPDLNIILYMPIDLSHKLVGDKKKRNYLLGEKRDQHEKDLNHLDCANKTYVQLNKIYPDQYSLINCFRNESLLSRTKIEQLIWEKVKTII